MIYLKNKDGIVFAYQDQDEARRFGSDDLKEMAEEEVRAHLNPTLAPLSRDDVKASRLRAYADPVTGSDRFFAEAARLGAMGGTEEEIEAVRASGATRYAEIQTQHPWPEFV